MELYDGHHVAPRAASPRRRTHDLTLGVERTVIFGDVYRIAQPFIDSRTRYWILIAWRPTTWQKIYFV